MDEVAEILSPALREMQGKPSERIHVASLAIQAIARCLMEEREDLTAGFCAMGVAVGSALLSLPADVRPLFFTEVLDRVGATLRTEEPIHQTEGTA